MKYEIGQQVWVAHFEPMAPTYVTCPDCGGTGRIRVTLHDETQVSIDCQNCAAGYGPPTGRIKIYRRNPSARITVITGVEIDSAKTVWKTDQGYIWDETDIFDTKEAAELCAVKKEAAYDLEQREKIASKEKDTRSWAWNASYHRREIERAKKQIEYHQAKLAVAAIKAKQDEAPWPAAGLRAMR